ncbi:MAG: hypothetical protein Kow0099_25850 [Candidatus Abyssubacteria bacterium]
MAEKKTKKKTADTTKKKMSVSDEIAPGRRMKLEEGVAREFDMPKQMAEEVSSSFSVQELVDSLRDKPEEEARKALDEFGRAVMKKVIELADTRYRDRTAEMIDIVAGQTGIQFPHKLQRYVELSVLALRPQDKWNITRSTTKEMRLQEYSCAIHKALTEASVNMNGLSCSAGCIAGFIEAARGISLKMRVTQTASLPEDGYCEFTFYPL